MSLQGHRMNRAVAQRLVDSGKAETIEEAMRVQARRAREALEAKHTEKELRDLSSRAGVAAAIKTGKYTKYPGVNFRKDTQKWRVQFSYKGKRIWVGTYLTEAAAAKAHDDYVRTTSA